MPSQKSFLPKFIGLFIISLSVFLTGGTCQQVRVENPLLGSGEPSRRTKVLFAAAWRRSIDPNYKSNPLTWKLAPEESAYPAIDEDGELVYVGSSRNFFAAFETDSGRLRWSITTKGRVVTRPTLHDNTVYFGTTSGMIYAYDRFQGKKLWSYQTNGEILAPLSFAPSSSSGKPDLLIATNSNNQLDALQAKDGKWLWHVKRDPPEQLTIRGHAPALIHEGIAYTGFSDGTVMAIKLKTGETLWSRSIRENERFADVDAPFTLYEEDYLFVASYSGSIYALHPKTGKVRWKYKMNAVSGFYAHEEELVASNAEGEVVLLSMATGKPRWKKFYKSAGMFSQPVGDENYIYLGSSRNGLYVLNLENGQLIQRIRFGSGFSSPPALYQTHLFALSNASFLYKFAIGKTANIIRNHLR